MKTLALAVILALVAAPAFGKDISRCVIEVDGTTWTDGPCHFTENGTDGSFVVTDSKPTPHAFAYIFMASSELPANGAWNGPHLENHAHNELGELKQDGACWVNDRAKVCAWQ